MASSSFNFLFLSAIFLLILHAYALDVYPGNSLHSSNYFEIEKITSENWTELNSVEDVWKSYPDRVRFLFEKLDFDKEELSQIKLLVEEGDTIKAAKELISYYKQSDSGLWLRNKTYEQLEQSDIKTANEILDDIVTLNGDSASVAYQNKSGWR